MSEVSFESNLDKILQNLDQDKIPRILEMMGLVAEGYAKRLCPVDTGNLRNSITHDSDMSDQTAVIGSNVEYGKYVELGTSKMSSQPFLRPAVEDHKSEYKNIAESIMKS